MKSGKLNPRFCEPRPKPWQQLRQLREELEEFESGLSKKLALVVANKADWPHSSKPARALARRTDLPVVQVSAATGEGIEERLKPNLFHLVGGSRNDRKQSREK